MTNQQGLRVEEKKYQALFYGELREDYTKEVAMRALGKVYHKESEFFEPWFLNDRTIVKKEATLSEAEHIRDYLADLGLVIKIEPINNEVSLKLNDDQKSEEIDTDKLLEEAFKEIQKTFKNVQPENISVVRIEPAPMLKRFMAYLIDMIICIVAANILLEVVLAPLGIINTELILEFSKAINAATTSEEVQSVVTSYFSNGDFASFMMQLTFFSLILQVLYFGFMDSRFDASFGKRLFRIKVYSLVSPSVLFKQAALRQSLMIASFFVLTIILNLIGLVFLIGAFVMGAYDKKGLNQTIFDRISKTVVGVDQPKE